MQNDYSFRLRQLLLLGAVMLLSPALRLFPSASALLAGRGAWLSALLAAAPLGLYAMFLCSFLRFRAAGEGLAELIRRSLSPALGRTVLVLSGLWLTFYAGFMLRAGADRFITTVYPNASPELFSTVMGALSLIAALGSARTMARTAQLVLPVVFGVLLTVLLTALFSVEAVNLLPLTRRAALPVLTGAVPAVNVVSVILYALAFLCGAVPKRKGENGAVLLWVGRMCVLLALISLGTVGVFGAELTAGLTRPFFSLVRDLVFFRSLERVEALVVSLWVFPDFLLCSVLLYSAQSCLRLALGLSAQYRGERIDDVSGGRYLIWLCATAAIITSYFLAPDAAALTVWSEKRIPAVNMLYGFVLLPAVYGIGRVRGRLKPKKTADR